MGPGRYPDHSWLGRLPLSLSSTLLNRNSSWRSPTLHYRLQWFNMEEPANTYTISLMKNTIITKGYATLKIPRMNTNKNLLAGQHCSDRFFRWGWRNQNVDYGLQYTSDKPVVQKMAGCELDLLHNLRYIYTSSILLECLPMQPSWRQLRPLHPGAIREPSDLCGRCSYEHDPPSYQHYSGLLLTRCSCDCALEGTDVMEDERPAVRHVQRGRIGLRGECHDPGLKVSAQKRRPM